MENPKNQIADRLKEANNVLVSVSADPSVDQLSAAIGLTLLLNKLGKHATAVFSGKVPSTIEFLKPEETLEKTTDSLRDFIIALDKSKADKLRYKVEDKMVKIFITPYRTSITEKDLEFSQGDFNVDVVIGLGVKVREDLDQAITSHGRILHDATVVSINTTEAGNLGSLNWVDNQASSLSEMVVALSDMLKSNSLDEQMSTALLTGIVSETERFSNAKTTSNTMNASAKLMAAGANQQLIATKLEEPVQAELEEPTLPEDEEKPVKRAKKKKEENADGSLLIDHDEELPEPQIDPIDIDEQGNLQAPDDPRIEAETRKILKEPPASDPDMPGYEEPTLPMTSRLVMEPPSLGGQLTANTQTEGLDPATDPLGSTPATGPLLSHDSNPVIQEDQPQSPSVPQADPPQVMANQTLSDIEESVDSPHLEEEINDAPQPDLAVDETVSEPAARADSSNLDQARDAVQAAVQSSPDTTPLEPIEALNAQPVNLDFGHNDQPSDVPQEPLAPEAEQPSEIHIDSDGQLHPSSQIDNEPLPPPPPLDNGMPSNLVPPMPGLPNDPTATTVNDPTAPPPVPPPLAMPPMMPPVADGNGQNDSNPLVPPVM